jgi:spoIIIJ-associated protein
VKDPVFAGVDVQAALRAAAEALALPVERLRYVVLDPGAPAGRGLEGRPARVAVLLQAGDAAAGPAPAPQDPKQAMLALVGAVGAAAGIVLEGVFGDDKGALVLRLSGDREFLLRDEAEVLLALEHLFQRIGADGIEERLQLDCEGFKEARESGLVERARSFAAEVRRSGQPKQFPPMNSYERRLVHVALQGEPGITTYSVGEGAARRLTIAPAPPATSGEPPAGE